MRAPGGQMPGAATQAMFFIVEERQKVDARRRAGPAYCPDTKKRFVYGVVPVRKPRRP
jgi:hypothetical protein